MKRLFLLCSLLGLVWACHSGSPNAPGPADLRVATDGAAATDQASPADQSIISACAPEKLNFTRDRGCENDGSVEFCIPQGDSALLDRLRNIDSAIQCAPGGGRARCDSSKELLCFLPTRGSACVGSRLSDEGWGKVCAISVLPAVRRVVHTIFE